ncbi:hypothetical protein VKT23_012371 [Stygiomarasmius scandens]|uniref:Type I restriction enzyme R protein N-terminal domain-containing protein n=1 Tax=Marasmiellus scandens TaxID=2682957 RepID=A0ABR1J5V2_9AGAR
MTWTDTITEQFALADRFTTDESDFYGPYNTLLTHVFPHSEHYQVVPQFKGPVTPGSIDFTTIYIVKKRKLPVMFIEIKTFVSLDDMAARELADRQMRDCFTRLLNHLKIPALYGISAMGTKFAVYKYDAVTRRLTPPVIARDPEVVNDVAPAERWTHELMEEGGEQVFNDIVEKVKSMCSGITNDP